MGSKWSPANCCCIFYTSTTGTKILLHLEIVIIIAAYIVSFAGLIVGKTFGVEVLETLLQENWIAKLGFTFLAPDENVHKDTYAEYKQALFLSLPFSILFLFFIIAPGFIAMKKKKPNWLIPYLLYKTLKAFGMIVVMVILHFNLTIYLIGVEHGGKRSPNFWGRLWQLFFPTNRTQKKFDVSVGYTMYAGFVLSVLLTVLQFHFALVIATCFKDMKEEIKASGKSEKSSASETTKSREELVYNEVYNL